MTLSVPPWRRLALRLTLSVTAIALAVLGALAFLGLRQQRRHLEGVVASVVALLTDNVRTSTHEHMLHDRRQEAYATMRAIARGEGVEKVRVFNKEGSITFSTDDREIGSVVDKRAESCYACHEADRPLERLSVSGRVRVYAAPDGHRILGMVAPIYNRVLQRNPRTLERDPYVGGWLLTLRPRKAEAPLCLEGTSAREWFGRESRRLAQLLDQEMGVASADGGEPLAGTEKALTKEQWDRLTSAFLKAA